MAGWTQWEFLTVFLYSRFLNFIFYFSLFIFFSSGHWFHFAYRASNYSVFLFLCFIWSLYCKVYFPLYFSALCFLSILCFHPYFLLLILPFFPKYLFHCFKFPVLRLADFCQAWWLASFWLKDIFKLLALMQMILPLTFIWKLNTKTNTTLSACF